MSEKDFQIYQEILATWGLKKKNQAVVYVFVNFTFYQRRISAIYEKNNFLSQWKVLQLCKVKNPDLLEFLKRHVSPVAFLYCVYVHIGNICAQFSEADTVSWI